MKAFISYSHVDSRYLDRLHVHLTQLQREGIITTWTDNDILPGGKLDTEISGSLQSSDIFIALLSPDYISSNYCFEKEFEKALEMQEDDQIIIIPIILENCDWLNTPFKQFKALPKDGKPIAEWNNENTAFLNVIQEIRNLTSGLTNTTKGTQPREKNSPSKNYKIKKDFDSIQKLDFQEKTFKEVKKYLLENISELESLNNISAKVTLNEPKSFEAILVNRNMIKTECTLFLSTDKDKNPMHFRLHDSEYGLNISLKKLNASNHEFSFFLSNDEYNLFWKANTFQNYSYGNQSESDKLTSKQISEEIWELWLKEVGIEF